MILHPIAWLLMWLASLLAVAGGVDATRVEAHYEQVVQWGGLAWEIFGADAPAALCLIAFESSGNPDAELRHPAKDSTIDVMVGLMQINHDDVQGRQPVGLERWQEQRRWKTKRLVAWLKQPEVNLQVARSRQLAAGWAPWAAAPFCGL